MRNENAFTFIEILVAMFIFSIIGAVVAGGVISGNKIKASQEGLIEIQQNVRVANMIMARDIRNAGYELQPHFNPLTRRSAALITNSKNDPNNYACPNNSDSLKLQFVNDSNVPVIITYYLQDAKDPNTGLIQRSLYRRSQDPSQPVVADQDRTVVVATNIDALWVTYYVNNAGSDLVWSGSPINPPTPLPAIMTGVPTTRAIGVTLVGSSTKLNKDLTGHVRTYTEPNVGGDRTVTFNDQFDHSMYSTIVGLTNFLAQM